MAEGLDHWNQVDAVTTSIVGQPVGVFRSQCIFVRDELGVTLKPKSGAFIIGYPDKQRIQVPFLVEVDEAFIILIGFRKASASTNTPRICCEPDLALEGETARASPALKRSRRFADSMNILVRSPNR
jgi:hypothetical protein